VDDWLRQQVSIAGCRIVLFQNRFDPLVRREERSCYDRKLVSYTNPLPQARRKRLYRERANVQEGKVARITLPIPWYTPRNIDRLIFPSTPFVYSFL